MISQADCLCLHDDSSGGLQQARVACTAFGQDTCYVSTSINIFPLKNKTFCIILSLSKAVHGQFNIKFYSLMKMNIIHLCYKMKQKLVILIPLLHSRPRCVSFAFKAHAYYPHTDSVITITLVVSKYSSPPCKRSLIIFRLYVLYVCVCLYVLYYRALFLSSILRQCWSL